MEKYKIELKPIEKIEIDSEIINAVNKAEKIYKNFSMLVKHHNFLIDTRQEIAIIPSEYIRVKIRGLSNDTVRTLLVSGCDNEINKSKKLIEDFKKDIDKCK